jgi:ATP-binding cassette subfamily F protein 3
VARLGTGVKVGYYAQDTADSLDMSGTVFDQVSAYGTEASIRNALGSFLFSGDDILKKASVLSGGERSRLALLKILLQPASLLILDEPTNHLDINSKDMLLRALQNYKGTIIFVSHDAYFIRAIADRILYLSDGDPEFFNGDYDYFQWKLDERLGIEAEAPKSARVLKAPKSQAERDSEFKASFDFSQQKAPVTDRAEANRIRNRRNKLKAEIEALMNSVDDLEVKIAEVNALMNLHENYSNVQKIADLAKRKEDLENQKNDLELQWIEKSDEYEREFSSESI